jgi:hypothetical protein
MRLPSPICGIDRAVPVRVELAAPPPVPTSADMHPFLFSPRALPLQTMAAADARSYGWLTHQGLTSRPAVFRRQHL